MTSMAVSRRWQRSARNRPASICPARLGEYGLAEVSGSLAPSDLAANTDIRVQFRNVEMPWLSPYTVKFAGRKIDDGRMGLDLRYVVKDSRLQGENGVVIKRLKLGDKVDHPGAVDLPLGLAVGLLKKPDGTIDIDMPVSGNLDDPKFTLGAVVFKAFVSLITKVATSPFKLLGSLVGVEADERSRHYRVSPGAGQTGTAGNRKNCSSWPRRWRSGPNWVSN